MRSAEWDETTFIFFHDNAKRKRTREHTNKQYGVLNVILHICPLQSVCSTRITLLQPQRTHTRRPETKANLLIVSSFVLFLFVLDTQKVNNLVQAMR